MIVAFLSFLSFGSANEAAASRNNSKKLQKPRPTTFLWYLYLDCLLQQCCEMWLYNKTLKIPCWRCVLRLYLFFLCCLRFWIYAHYSTNDDTFSLWRSMMYTVVAKQAFLFDSTVFSVYFCMTWTLHGMTHIDTLWHPLGGFVAEAEASAPGTFDTFRSLSWGIGAKIG